MTGICAVCVAIARPYALGIPGRARHDARVSGTADMQFRTIAVLPGPSRHGGKSTANAVGRQRPPGFKSPILRSDQQFRRALRLGGLLVSALRGLCVAIAAIRPPVYLIATRRRAGPAKPGIRAGSLR